MHKEFYGLDPMAQKGLENIASSIYSKRIVGLQNITN